MTAEIHDFHRGRGERQTPGPHNIEAEQALLGAILINNEAFGCVSGFLKPEHFSEELHWRIFDVASQLLRAGKVVTPITLKTFLGDTDLGGVTIPQYLARLAAEATAIVNTEDYGRTVHDLATRRDLICIGERLSKLAHDQPVSMSCADVAAAGSRICKSSPSDRWHLTRVVSLPSAVRSSSTRLAPSCVASVAKPVSRQDCPTSTAPPAAAFGRAPCGL